ncbi:MAG: GNAT family N-acetyltransferase [Janthinobacterium lividum]
MRSFVLRDDLPVPAVSGLEAPAGSTVLVVLAHEPADPEPVGAAVLTGDLPVLELEQLWVRPDDRDLVRTVAEMVCARASSAGAAVLTVEVPRDDATLLDVVAETKVLGEVMTKRLAADVAPPAGLGWRPMTRAELGPWQDRQVLAYAEDNLERCGGDLELARERAQRDFASLLPDGLATPDTSIVLLVEGGEPVGHLWVRHRREPGLSFVYDVEVAEQHRGRGLGRAAMVVAEVLARRAGDDRLGLHVFGGNDVARGLYGSQGYTVSSTQHDLLVRQTPT